MKLNVDKLKAKTEQLAEESRQRRASWPKPQGAPDAAQPEYAGSTYRGQGYQDLDELLASGDFRRLIVRPDGRDGGSWTLKAVLLVRSRSLHVYMHGVVSDLVEMRPLIDRLLRKGDWHEDKYPAKGD